MFKKPFRLVWVGTCRLIIFWRKFLTFQVLHFLRRNIALDEAIAQFRGEAKWLQRDEFRAVACVPFSLRKPPVAECQVELLRIRERRWKRVTHDCIFHEEGCSWTVYLNEDVVFGMVNRRGTGPESLQNSSVQLVGDGNYVVVEVDSARRRSEQCEPALRISHSQNADLNSCVCVPLPW